VPLTPADVRNREFSTTRLRPGYAEEEVDAFLDEVEAELDRLLKENEELRSELAASLRGDRSAGSALLSPLPGPGPAMAAPQRRAPVMLGAPPALPPEQDRRPDPVLTGTPGHNMDSVARVLSLAQQTADQAVADARREAGETLGQARAEASGILGRARHQAEQITSDARARSESLDRDAQERRRQALGSLTQQREELERRVDDLRTFERECRSRLTAYLEGQLRDLEAGTAGSGAFPAVMADQHPGISGARPHEPDTSGSQAYGTRA
jgi:DivIVA domain-containing protein